MNRAAAAGELDFEPLLAPISAAQPCGVPLRYADTYRLIEEARRADDANLPQGIWEQPLKRADWQQVEALCVAALTERSKDLQIAAWLCEAWVALRGLDGLAAGLHLLRALAETYWDDVHPQMEDGDIEFRSAPFDWLNKNINLVMLQLTLAEGRGAGGQPFRLGTWEMALRAELAAPPPGRNRPATPPSDQLTRAQFVAAAAQMGADYYRALRGRIEQAAAALELLGDALDQRMGRHAPLFGAIAARIDLCYATVHELAGELADDDGADFDDEDAGMDSMDETNQAAPQPAGRRAAPQSREDAYRQLDEVADYLLRTEPHSPVPYLVKRAVAWGAMPLAELLQELLDSESDLKQIYRLLGTNGN